MAVNKFQDVIGGVAKTSLGALMLAPGPVVDPDKATVAFVGDEKQTVLKLLALRDQVGLLIPQAQKLRHPYEKAVNEYETQKVRHDVGQISDKEFEKAKIDLQAAERGLNH